MKFIIKMIKSKKLKNALEKLQNINISSVMSEFNIIKQQTQPIKDIQPSDISLDSIILVTQQTKNKKIRKVEFTVCDKWLKPNNVFTLIAKGKQKLDSNAWILFYDSNTWYIRKGLKAASTVHVKLVSSPKEQE